MTHIGQGCLVCSLACSKIGIWFTDYAYTTNDSKPIQLVPQVMNIADSYFFDAIAWYEISGNYIANGGEKYITIGPYDDEINIDTFRVLYPADPIDDFSYYYIDGCSIFDVNESSITNSIYIPNIFSPNGDGINDIMFVRGVSIQDVDFNIYNRWGELVFSTKDINFGWDGTRSGIVCDNAVYIYYVSVIFLDGTHRIIKGNISLIK